MRAISCAWAGRMCGIPVDWKDVQPFADLRVIFSQDRLEDDAHLLVRVGVPDLVQIHADVEEGVGVVCTRAEAAFNLVDEKAHKPLGFCPLGVVLPQAPHERHHPILVPPAPVQLVVRLEVGKIFVDDCVQLVPHAPLEMRLKQGHSPAHVALCSAQKARARDCVCNITPRVKL